MKSAISAFFVALVLVSSASAAELDSQAQNAVKILKKATFFAIDGVGYAGQISEGEKTLQFSMRHRQATQAFSLVLSDKKSSKGGQLFALLGLKWKNSAEFQKRIAPYLSDQSELESMSGCIIMRTSVGELARQIKNGTFKPPRPGQNTR